MKSFSHRLRERRTVRRLGLRETATTVGISPAYLSLIETRGTTVPAEQVIRRLATLLDDDFDELMSLAGRISSAIEDIVVSDPTMSKFLRAASAQKLSGDVLMELLAPRLKSSDSSRR